MAKVELKKIEKTYPNGFKAVHGVDLEIKDGEFMVLVGPSGCAKSTILRMISGLEDISGGELYIGDKMVNDLPPKDRKIAMVFQNYALYPHMTAYENMAFGLKLKKTPKDEIDKRVKMAAEKLEITELLDRLPKEMSGGQRQRIAVGRAIVRDPEVFLFDEPLSNLDAKLRTSLRVEIKELHNDLKAEGKTATMVYVTHDQVEAMTMGDRICVLNYGEVMQVDTPTNLYNYPKNKFVATFIGSPRMNIFEVDIVREGEDAYVLLDGRKIRFDQEKTRKLLAYGEDKAYFGIRPESLRVVKDPSDNTVEGKVSFVEEMGSEELIYFDILGSQCIVRETSEDRIKVAKDEERVFSINVDRAHLFHIDSEENIFYN